MRFPKPLGEWQMERSENEAFDALMKLADFRLSRAFNRRQHEWKVTLGVWALLAAAIVHPLPNHKYWIAILVIIISLAHIFLWIRVHWITSTTDFRIAFWFAEIAEMKLNLRGSPNPKDRPKKMISCEKWLCFLCEPTCLAQILTTIALASGVILRNYRDL